MQATAKRGNAAALRAKSGSKAGRAVEKRFAVRVAGAKVLGKVFLPECQHPRRPVVVLGPEGTGALKQHAREYDLLCRSLARTGFCAAFFDSRGQWRSGGSWRPEHTTEDLLAVIEFLSTPPLDANGPVGVFGRCATGFSVMRAARLSPRMHSVLLWGLLYEWDRLRDQGGGSSESTLRRLNDSMVRLAPEVERFNYDARREVGGLRQPTLILHSPHKENLRRARLAEVLDLLECTRHDTLVVLKNVGHHPEVGGKQFSDYRSASCSGSRVPSGVLLPVCCPTADGGLPCKGRGPLDSHVRWPRLRGPAGS